jgi:V/A-type H+-transporting ATPase subunit I
MIIRMDKVRIIGPKSLFEKVTDLLQTAGVVHIESQPLAGRPEETGRLERFWLDPDYRGKKVELERMLKELDRLILVLPEIPFAGGVPAAAFFVMDEGRLGEVREAIETARGKIESALNQIREREEEDSLLGKYEHVLEALAPLLQEVRDIKGLDFIGLVLETPAIESPSGGRGGVLPEIRQALSELTENRFELFLSRIDKETSAGLLVIPRELSARVRTLLWEENISELRLPAALADRPVGEALKILLRRRTELPPELSRLRQALQDLSLEWREPLKAYKRMVENWLARLESTVYFYQTRSTFVIYGWVPREEFPHLHQHLMQAFREKVVMEKMGIVREEVQSIPVALRNPPILKSFETFTRLMALPRYGSIDPTPFVALFFPLFYGIILGDIGYGIILFGLSLFVRKRWEAKPLIRDLSAIFTFASLWTIFFGILYGELFGDEMAKRLGLHPVLFNRMEGFLLLLKMTLAVGLVHVFLGIVLGLITAVRQRDSHQLIVKLCGMFFLLGLLTAIGSFTGFFPQAYAAGGVILALAMLFPIFILGGTHAAPALHNVVNVLSYLRLMGIGVASAALAFAANTLGGLVGNVALAAVVMLVFHLINLVFGIVSPTIQSLRLHYVEFFENFFQAGGREYRPFKRV